MGEGSPGVEFFYDFIPMREVCILLFLLTSTIFNVGTGWIILHKTPSFMNDFKKYLLELLVFCLLFHYICLIYSPYVLYTRGKFMMTSISFSNIIGIPLSIEAIMIIFGQGAICAGFSNVHCFFYRMYVLLSPEIKKLAFKIFYGYFITVILLSELSVVLIATRCIEPSDTFISFAASNDLYTISSRHRIYVVSMVRILQCSPIFLFIGATTGLSSFFMMTYIHYFLYTKRTHMSMKTKMVHRQLFWALTVKFAATICCGICPVFLTAIAMVFHFPRMATFLNIVYIICFWSYGYSLAGIILLSNQPYRKYMRDKSRLISWAMDFAQKTTAPITGLIIVEVSTMQMPSAHKVRNHDH